MVLKAMPLVLREFPDARIRIGSCLRIIPHSLIEKMAPTNYGGYLYDMIKTLKLENHIDFLGNLTEEQMITEYLKANVFISPSSLKIVLIRLEKLKFWALHLFLVMLVELKTCQEMEKQRYVIVLKSTKCLLIIFVKFFIIELIIIDLK